MELKAFVLPQPLRWKQCSYGPRSAGNAGLNQTVSSKILFICPSLEPGRSGVGDFTQVLSERVAESGTPCGIVALNDPHVSDCSFGLSGSTQILRLPTNLAWHKKLHWLTKFWDEFEPSWISLQFVTYGYHPKGLPFRLANRLRLLKGEAEFEIMFHEIWCGGRGASLRHLFYGILQRWIIRDMMSKLRPKVVHSHSLPYLEALRLESWPAKQLRLFSNIPVVPHSNPVTFRDWILTEFGVSISDQTEIFCLFGTIYPEWIPESILPLIRGHLEGFGKEGIFLAIGNLGDHGTQLMARLQSTKNERLRFLVSGPLPTEMVSLCLSSSHYGVSTTPPDLVEKSAAAAAMFEHGLPVLAGRLPAYGDEIAARVVATQPLLVQGADLSRYFTFKKLEPDPSGAERVATQFCRDLVVPKSAHQMSDNG